MLQVHDQDNVAEFVLHELCCKNCFNLCKAAYFIDNPDFDCLKGVAGFAQDEAFSADKPIWVDPGQFTAPMQAAPFNQQVRSCLQISCRNCTTADEVIMQAIADELGLTSFNYCTWNMKHGNHGYLIYQADCTISEPEDLIGGVSLLGFCPVF